MYLPLSQDFYLDTHPFLVIVHTHTHAHTPSSGLGLRAGVPPLMRMRPLLSGRSHPSTGPGTGHSRGARSWAPEARLSQSVGGLCWVQPARAAPVRTLARCLSPWGPGHLLKGAAAPALHLAACMRRLVWSARLSQKPGNLLPPPAALPCAECGQGPELGLGAGSAGPPHRTGFTKAFSGVISA